MTQEIQTTGMQVMIRTMGTIVGGRRWHFSGWARRLAGMAATMLVLRRHRRELRSLDDRTLKDLGLSRADVEREAGRPYWELTG